LKYLKLLRIHHWVKNLFIFIPAFFGGVINQYAQIIDLSIGFLSFSLVASGIYIINDIKDIEEDRRHPVKQSRPLPSGQVSISTARILMVIVLTLGMLLSYSVAINLTSILFIYFSLNLGYSYGLKTISILDIFIVSSGFALRAIAGGIISHVELSQWLMIMIFLLSLFLSLAKRRDDLVIAGRSGVILRKASNKYSIDYINIMLAILAAVIIVSYIMYTISPEVILRLSSKYLYLTAIFVMMGLFRYLQLCTVENSTGSPIKIFFSDLFIQLTVAAWVGTFFAIIYFR